MLPSRARERLLNSLTVTVALITLGVLGYRLGRDRLPTSSNTEAKGLTASPIPNFADIVETGRRIGAEDAQLVIVEFGDFQCPACVGFHATMDSLLQKYPNDVALVWRHFPLPYHRLAYPLARASECAGAQDRFRNFYDMAFLLQGDLGLVTVTDIGKRAGIPDLQAFQTCLSDTARVPAVERDLALAKSISVPGTPGVLINGMLYANGASLGVRDFERMLTKHRYR